MIYPVVLDGGLTVPQCRPEIWRWWINVFFSSTVPSIMPLSSVLCCISGIATGNVNGSSSGFWGASLALCGTTIYSLNCYSGSPLINELLLVIIESIIVYRNVHEKIGLYDTPYPRSRETVTSCIFATQRVL